GGIEAGSAGGGRGRDRVRRALRADPAIGVGQTSRRGVMARSTGPTAAIAGITPGVQGQGIWTGRRQLFVRFAGEAETAVPYTAEMLGKQVGRAVANTALHSIALAGRDPLASSALILETFAKTKPPLPVMLDCDGQRPDDAANVAAVIAMLQVTF